MPPLCLAIYPTAQAADSFTAGSNSSRHITRALRAPQSTTACGGGMCGKGCVWGGRCTWRGMCVHNLHINQLVRNV